VSETERGRADRGIGVYFFSAGPPPGSAGPAAGQGRYDVLLDAARAADTGGLDHIWLPERHFQPFGGDHPNPSVLAAAVAMVTRRVRIRAGSVVLPLHHPARVAEEWAVVDNLSGGRVELSAATGWHPADFAFAPEHFPDRAAVTQRHLHQVDALWRGELVDFPVPGGRSQPIQTFPRPVQRALPWWITAAGSPETFALAGRLGAGILTGYGAFTPNQLAERIALYRAASWAEHTSPGRVAVMIHTAMGPSGPTVRSEATIALRRYLSTYVRQRDDEDAAKAERSLEFGVQRYLRTGSLIGSPAEVRDRLSTIFDAGVDDVSALVDFGVSAETVAWTLTALCELRTDLLGAASPRPPGTPASLIPSR
jgi:natural product biosynthesis luciferase-like monooxygenase protein